MNVFREAYQKSLFENEKQIKVWNEHLSRLKNLDLTIFQNKLKIPALIPMGSRILFRGELIHTNELTVSLGAGYFVKCSVKQAEIIRQHRISVAEEKLRLLQKEQEYLENQLSFTRENVWNEPGKEIIEEYDENAENEWKLQHRENIRKHKKETKCSGETLNTSDNEIWEKLEELELREELENELEESEQIFTNKNTQISKPLSYLDKEEEHVHIVNFNTMEEIENTSEKTNMSTVIKTDAEFSLKNKNIEELNRCLSELKDDLTPSCTKEDLLKRLDQMEEQEMLEDELDRLDDSAEEDDINLEQSNKPKHVKKSITFASECEEECIEINFNHSDVSPKYSNYHKKTGILNPRDIYAAHPENFQVAPVVPILKKSSIKSISKGEDLVQAIESAEENVSSVQETKQFNINIIGDVLENKNEDNKESKVANKTERPLSKFKIMRMQKQS